MQQWQYNILMYTETTGFKDTYNNKEFDNELVALESLGNKGWELVQIYNQPDKEYPKYYFKRPQA